MSNHSQILPAALSRLVGETLEGRYRLDAIVGVGGMGVVFRAEQIGLERTVAVKILDPAFAESDGYTQRFRREAKSIARLDHVNCLQMYDYGTTDDDLNYIVMPLLRGRPLDELVEKGQTLAPRCAMRILAQVLAGLEHAHRRGLVHRDLKPSNLLVEQRGPRFCDDDVVRIVDFGIAKIVDDDAPSVSRVGMLFGTPAYMSPEQALGEPLDARSDLYAAGLVAYRLITGDVPHRGRTVMDQLQRRTSLELPGLPEDCPSAVAEVIAKLCAREPRRRYASAAKARAAVLDALGGAPSSGDARWDAPRPPAQVREPVDASGGVVTVETPGARTGELSGGLGGATWELDLACASGEFPRTQPEELAVAATRGIEGPAEAEHARPSAQDRSPPRSGPRKLHKALLSVMAFAGVALLSLVGGAACGASGGTVDERAAAVEAEHRRPTPSKPVAGRRGKLRIAEWASGDLPAPQFEPHL